MTRSEIFASVLGPARNPVIQFVGALCTYREARGEATFTKLAQAYSLINRVLNPGWWGTDVLSVVLRPWQYSSFNYNDPNNRVWPLGVKRPNISLNGLYQRNSLTPFINEVILETQQSTQSDTAWNTSLSAFNNAVSGTLEDPTLGATSYFDISINNNLPKWATDGSQVQTIQIGRLRFWKVANP